MEDLSKKERRMRSMTNPSPRGDLNLLEISKLFARTIISLDMFVRNSKKKALQVDRIQMHVSTKEVT